MVLDHDSRLQDVYISEYFKSLNCPRSLTCYLLWKHGEHKQLVSLDWYPHDYNNGEDAQNSLAATKFLSKATFLSTGNDVKAIAIAGFKEAEQVCRLTNDRFLTNTFSNPYSLSILQNMKVKIARLLGKFNPVEFVDSSGWGPGATTLLKRRDSSYPKKFDAERRITPKAYGFVKEWFHLCYPNWIFTFEIDSNSKIVTVPKNAKTDRVIAIEPGLNLWFQKGIGAMIRRKLKHNGIDLNDQRHNQRLARIGSLFGDLATIDFSAASDTIAYELVKDVLPCEWFDILNTFRSGSGLLGKDVVEFSKFSSMGNGFTFELESLIFYALAEACCFQLGIETPVISVYGDDVILPVSAVHLFTSVSKDLGFTVNASKSYSSTPFRESCGSYYWQGVSVKPIFQKEPLNGKASILKAANNLRRSAHSRNYYGCDRRLRRGWQLLVQGLGKSIPKISDGYGDVGLVVNFGELGPGDSVTRAKHGYEGFHTRVWSIMADRIYFETPGLLLEKLKSIGKLKGGFDPFNIADDVGSGNSVPSSGQYKFVRMRILIPRWYDMGPWV